MKGFRSTWITGTGKLLDGPVRVIALVVNNDAVGAGTITIKDANGGNTLLEVDTAQSECCPIIWGGDGAWIIPKGKEFYVATLTNCDAHLVYEGG